MRKVIAGLVVATGVVGVALAHGPAAWIQHGPYVDKDGVHCCGEHDCAPVDPALLVETDAGITYLGQTVLKGRPDGIHGGVYWSAEPDPPAGQRWWVCRRNGKNKCIFRPQPGS